MNLIKGISATGEVTIDGERLPLEPSLKVRVHSPTGFAWGYGGSGPSQLALAILMRFTDNKTALRLHHDFKFQFLAGVKPFENLRLEVDVKQWIKEEQL